MPHQPQLTDIPLPHTCNSSKPGSSLPSDTHLPVSSDHFALQEPPFVSGQPPPSPTFSTMSYHSLNLGHSQDILLPGVHDLLTPLYVRGFELPPSSPNNGSSSSAMDTSSTSSSPYLQSVHVICNAPLVAPIPLPYHSPSFLQFELPDADQDLSHPPYTHRATKRKRVPNDYMNELVASKRRSVTPSSFPNSPRRTTRRDFPDYLHTTAITRPRCYS